MLLMDHLPECSIGSDDDYFNSWMIDECICDRLRACEQRVLEEAGDRVAAVFAGTWPGSPAYLLTLRHLRHSVIAAAMNDRTMLMRKSNAASE
jgi:hypothetical protein